MQRAKSAALDFEIAAVESAIRKDAAATVTYARAALNAGRAIGDMPRLLAQATRKRAAVRATRIVLRLLAWGEPDGLDALQRELLAEADGEWLAASVRGERAALDRAVATLAVEAERDAVFKHRLPEKTTRAAVEERLVLFGARPYRAARLADQLRLLDRALAVYDLPPGEWVAKQRNIENTLPGPMPTVLHGFWRMPMYVPHGAAARGDLRARAELRATAAVMACERFRRAKGRWPNSLDEIPKSILAAIPLDPYDGKPLRLKPLPDGIAVYSVGPDLRDDGGEFGNENRGAALDNGVRLWNPELRGLPPPKPDDEP